MRDIMVEKRIKMKKIQIKYPKNNKEFDEKVDHIDVFYNRNIRFWTLIPKNKDGYDVREAEYSANRKQMETNLKVMKKEFNIK